MMIELVLVLDNLRSCHNVGSILRTANGFGYYNFIFIGTTPYPLLKNDMRLPYLSAKQTQQISKTALGAQMKINGQYLATVDDFLKQRDDYPLICLEQTPNSQNIQQFKLKQKSYFVIGNEVEGIDLKIIAKAQTCLKIPMLGDKESFNVSVATGIALYQLNSF